MMEKLIETTQLDSLPQSIAEKIRKVFPSFDSSKLEEADLKMLRQIQAGEASEEDYENYRQSVIKSEGGHMAKTEQSSRLKFVDFLGDVIQNKLFPDKSKEK